MATVKPVRPVTVGVVPAAGLGTRFLPISRAVPKELLPLVDTAVIEVVVRELAESGIDRVVVVVAPGKEAVGAYFQPSPRLEQRLVSAGRAEDVSLLRRPERLARVTTTVQPEPKGNGDAVLMARPFVGDEPFAMLWGDDVQLAGEPAIAQLLRARQRLGGGTMIGCIRVPRAEAPRYGMVQGTRVDARTTRVSGIVEKPSAAEAPSELAAVHGYILEPEIFDALATLRPGRGGELWLSDAVGTLAAGGLPVWAVELEGHRYDTGDRAGYAAAFVEHALNRDDTGPAVRAALRALGWEPADR